MPASGPSIATRSGAAIRALPCRRVIRFFLKRVATPVVSPCTTCAFRRIIAGRSSATSPTVTPWAASRVRACQKSSLESRSALDGMQPMRRQVPPSAASRSTQTTRMPSWAARMAAT